MIIDLRLTIRRSVLLGGLAVPIPLSRGDALSVVSGDILPEEISSMLWRRSWDDEDDLLSSSTVSCGEAGSNVLSSWSDCESICDSAVNIYIKRLQTRIIYLISPWKFFVDLFFWNMNSIFLSHRWKQNFINET